jgi:AcrR family transcriptional regulator
LIFFPEKPILLPMGRPRKAEMGDVSTRERLYMKALELFASKGFESVSVREITRALGLTEASLYIHFTNKAALLEEIFHRLDTKLIEPGFQVPPPEYFRRHPDFEAVAFLISGAKTFFRQADREIILIWRMVMIGQYRYEQARKIIEEKLLDAPVRFFTAIFENMEAAGRLKKGTDSESLGRMVGALFFNYSFRSNLKAAWGEETDPLFTALSRDLVFVMKEHLAQYE